MHRLPKTITTHVDQALMARRALLTLAVVTLSSCWKRDYVVQPKLDFEVRDAAGPISGAKVRLLTSTDPHHRREALVDVVTDARGLASLEEKHERVWIFPLVMHGVPFYSWQWCVEAPGHSAQVSERRVYPRGAVSVELRSSTSDEHCSESGGDFSVVK